MSRSTLPDDAEIENARAMIEITRKYGEYRRFSPAFKMNIYLKYVRR